MGPRPHEVAAYVRTPATPGHVARCPHSPLCGHRLGDRSHPRHAHQFTGALWRPDLPRIWLPIPPDALHIHPIPSDLGHPNADAPNLLQRRRECELSLRSFKIKVLPETELVDGCPY